MQTALVLATPGPVPTIVPPPITSKTPDAGVMPAPVILFGRDERGRPHGACFVGSDAAAVEHAADLMDLYAAPAETDALRDLAGMLPLGRLFPASGKAFVPFIKATLFAQLLAATDLPDAPRPVRAAGKPAEAGSGAGVGQGSGASGSGAGGPAGKGGGANAPSDWAGIKIGSVVLAEDENEGGYYAAKVVATKIDDHVQLVWTGYPDLPEFGRPRRALALLHPESVEASE